MKRITITVLLSILLIFLESCEQSSFDQPEDSDQNGSGLEVDILQLTLSSGDLSTIPGRNPVLTVSIFPDFATRNELNWISTDNTVAAIDSGTGIISVRTEAVTSPMITIIRVESVYNPAVYALCPLTVYPSYPADRHLTFPSETSYTGRPTDTYGDIDMGDGLFLLVGTGGASEYNNGNNGPGEYWIDPENPYEFGIVPNGQARTITFNSGGYADFSTGHIRTSGNGSRMIKIAALFRPFEIKVNYRSNAAEPRHADIRIGDTEGIRIEGEESPGNGNGQGRTVTYIHNLDEEGNPKDDFVPLVFIECKAGIQIYDVYVNDLSQ